MNTLQNLLLLSLLALSAPALAAKNSTPPPPKSIQNNSLKHIPRPVYAQKQSSETRPQIAPLSTGDAAAIVDPWFSGEAKDAYQVTDAGAVTREPDNIGAAPEMLPRLGVEGEASSMQESAYGPVEGFVAKRSATATKTDTPVIETPQSISVVSRKDMDTRNVRDIGDAVAYSSGVLSGNAGEKNLFGGSSIKIRGHGGRGSNTTGASGNLHLDGLRVPADGYQSSNLDPWLFERIEVLKGPASVLFGQSHPGGIVNLISKRPHDGMYNQIRFSSGNFDKAGVAFDLGAELNDAWQLRIVGLGLDGETQQIYSERERYLIAPSLRWTNGATDLILLMHYQHDDINANFYNHAPRAAVFGNPNGRLPLSFRAGDPSWDLWDTEIRSIGYLFSHQFNDALAFRQNLRYTHSGLKEARRVFHNFPLDSSQRILTRFNIVDRTNADEVTIDNQLQWKLTTGSLDHTLLIGIDYRRSSGNDSGGFVQAPSLDLFAPVYNQTFPVPPITRQSIATFEHTGIYIQDQIKAGNLSLLIGGRYDKARFTYEEKPQKTRPSRNQNISDNAFTGRIGTIYNFNNGLAPYASYAESFEPLFFGSAFDGSPFEPEEGKQYEVGVKYQPAGADHLITLAAFDLTQENMLTADPINPGFHIQIGEVQTRGMELEGKFNFNDNLQVTGAYTYLDDKVTESNTGDKGKRRQQIPEHNASLWANYSFNRGIFSGMGIGMGVRYIGKTEGDRLNTFSVPGYTLVDLAAHYDLGKSPLKLQGWQVSLNANNLFDRYYIASCYAAHMCRLGRERAVRFSVGYDWDW